MAKKINYKYRVTGSRGGKYLTTTLAEAKRVAGKSGKIAKIGGKKRNPTSQELYTAVLAIAKKDEKALIRKGRYFAAAFAAFETYRIGLRDSAFSHWDEVKPKVMAALAKLPGAGSAKKRNPKAIPKTKDAFISEYYKLLDKWATSRKYLGAGKYTPLTQSAKKAGARLQEMVEAHYGWAALATDQWEADYQLNRNPCVGLHFHKGEFGEAKKFLKGKKRNPKAKKWMQAVDAEMEERGTVGAFTKQARRAGYASTMEYARKVMAGWRSGSKKVYNKKTRKQQTITKRTMYRANFAINAQKRRNPDFRLRPAYNAAPITHKSYPHGKKGKNKNRYFEKIDHYAPGGGVWEVHAGGEYYLDGHKDGEYIPGSMVERAMAKQKNPKWTEAQHRKMER